MQQIKFRKKAPGSAITDEFFLLAGFAAAILLGFVVFRYVFEGGGSVASSSGAAQSAAANSQQANPYAVLTPATVPSKAVECDQQISFNSNGTSGPVTCSNGDLNIQEWNALATLEPKVLTLGYGATAVQVQSALCADIDATLSDANTTNSNLVEENVYQIASLYYGWKFTPPPSDVLTNGTC